MVTVVACPFVIMQATIVALIVERDSNAWKLGADVELVTIFYSVSNKKSVCVCVCVYT